MKKILSLILAAIMAVGIAIPAFAADEVTTVDNTFDNFAPAPGTKAPDNWYDPYCYDEDGHINPYCLNRGGERGAIAMYCPEYKRIFTLTDMGRTQTGDKVRSFKPYDIFCPDWHILDVYGDVVETDKTQWYCPYCGKYEFTNYTNEEEYRAESAIYSHKKIESIVYGYHCDKCGEFCASHLFCENDYDPNVFQFSPSYCDAFSPCQDRTDVNTVKLYRFLKEEQRNAEYSFIFTETEADFGDGKDGRVEDLKTNDAGVYDEWDSEDNPYREESAKDKFVNFFKSIGDFFTRIWLWFINLFK